MNAGSPARRRISLRAVMWGMLFGMVVGLPGTLIVLAILQKSGPRMKGADFAAAQERWEKRQPAGYMLDIENLVGGETTEIHVEFRGGHLTSVAINGKPEKRLRLGESWSIPEMFAFIQRDLDRNEAAAKEPGGPAPMPVYQQAQFDPIYGYPVFYRRTELEGGQTGEWRIIGFSPLPAAGEGPGVRGHERREQ